jgi:hypothetical protein
MKHVKKKKRAKTKRKQKQAVEKAARRKMTRAAQDQVRVYMKQRRHVTKGRGERVEEDKITLDTVCSMAKCDGVGNCCKDRPLFVEPADVFRIVKNEQVRKTFGVTSTRDLYRSEEGKRLLMYTYDREQRLPVCMVVSKEYPGSEGNVRVCSFYRDDVMGPVCILGEDRLTCCKSDPITRFGRVTNKRTISGWGYDHNKIICASCPQADPNGVREQTVGSWLKVCGAEERYRESDLFLAFIDCMKGISDESLCGIASGMIFDWDGFRTDETGKVDNEIIGPASVDEIIRAAHSVVKLYRERKDLEGNDG